MLHTLPDWLRMTAAMLLACALSHTLTPAVKVLAEKLGAVDQPGGRRIHDHPIPRLGGLALCAAFLAAALLFARLSRPVAGLLLGSLVILLMGAADDLRQLSPWRKLALQTGAAAIALSFGVRIEALSVKEVTFTDDVSELTTYNFKPQLKTVGPKYGKQLGGIKEYLANVDGNKAMAELKADGAIKFEVGGVEISLAEEDLLIEMTQKEGYVTEADNYVTVVLDTNLTDELLEEGCVNEIISKLQTMRKDSGFEVMDRIKLYIDGNDKLAEIVKKNEAAIAGKVLANEVLYGTKNDAAKEWNINGEKVFLGVEKI